MSGAMTNPVLVGYAGFMVALFFGISFLCEKGTDGRKTFTTLAIGFAVVALIGVVT